VDEIDVSQAVAVIVQEAPFTEPVPASIETKETTIISSRLLARITGIAVPAGNRSRLLLPVERIARVGQLDVVWVAHEGKAERRFVRLGQTTTEGMVEVITGLQAGELVLPRPR
jgi:hypothetical protein